MAEEEREVVQRLKLVGGVTCFTNTEWHMLLRHCVHLSVVVIISPVHPLVLDLLVDAVNLTQH